VGAAFQAQIRSLPKSLEPAFDPEALQEILRPKDGLQDDSANLLFTNCRIANSQIASFTESQIALITDSQIALIPE
jgi:hypothetical protein